LIYLVEVENEVELANVPKESVQDLDEEVYGLQIGELVIIRIDADAEEETCISPINDPHTPELDKVGLMLLVARGDQAVDFALEADLFLILIRGVS